MDGLMQERRNSIANALELRLSCTNPSIFTLNDSFFLSLLHKILWMLEYLYQTVIVALFSACYSCFLYIILVSPQILMSCWTHLCTCAWSIFHPSILCLRQARFKYTWPKSGLNSSISFLFLGDILCLMYSETIHSPPLELPHVPLVPMDDILCLICSHIIHPPPLE